MRSAAAFSTLAVITAVALACGEPRPARSTPADVPRDDFGDTLVPRSAPRRIVSLNPTTTEILFALGAGPRLVGRTRWDLYPAAAIAVPDMGDGIRPNVEAILAARPDLVVLYASNDNRPAAEALRRAGVQTLSVRVDLIEDFRRVTTMLGRAIGDTARARIVVDTVMASIERARAATRGTLRPTAFWLMWETPLLTIGGGSYLSELLEIAGARNVYDSVPQPSPQVAFEDVVRRDPDVILASPEGAATIASRPTWRSLRAVRAGRVLVVDTALVFRPSVRLGEAALSLARLLHPSLAP